MKYFTNTMTVVLLIATAVLYQCTKKLVEEVVIAEKAIAEAQAAGAAELAPVTFKAAIDKLAVAKDLNEKKKVSAAKAAFSEVVALAKTALAEALAAREEAEQAALIPEEPTVKTEHYVENGEFLWRIAGYDDVYGDTNAWLQLYKANQDRIDRNFENYLAYITENKIEKIFDHPAQLINAGWTLAIAR